MEQVRARKINTDKERWSLIILKGFCTYTHRTQMTNWSFFFCQDGHGVMNVLFFSTEFFSDRFFRFSCTCSSNYSVYDGSVHTLTCCTHVFLLHSLSAHLRTSSCVSHTRMAQVSVKRFFAHVSFLSISPSPFSWDSPILAVPWRSLRDQSRSRLHWRPHPHDLAVLSPS